MDLHSAEASCPHVIPHLRPTDRLLDVGCGPGTVTESLSGHVGSVVGLERNPRAVAMARSRGLDVVEGDAVALPFPDDSFDVVHAHQAMHHITDPVLALREMARVSRRLVAVRDMDWAGFSWWPRHPGLDQWYASARAHEESHGGDLDAGRKLLAWAREAGLSDVTASSSTWCFATADEKAAWASGQGHHRELFADFVADEGAWLSVLHGEIVVRLLDGWPRLLNS